MEMSLVLSRKMNERIIIGDNITIAVVEIRPDKVRLAIDAPDNVTIHREEVYVAIKRSGGEFKKTVKVESKKAATEVVSDFVKNMTDIRKRAN